MAEQGGQPDPVAAEVLESVLSHPGLQATQAPDGTGQAAADPTAERFLETFSGQPATTPVAPTPAEPTAPETNGQTPTGGRLYAGKYRSVDELERAAIEKERTLRDREAELRAAKAVNQHLEDVFAPLREQTRRETPRPHIPVTFDERQNPVIDPAAVMAMVEERAREIAREQVQETLRPLSALSSASSRLRGEYPELANQEAQFSAWLSANPEMQERVTKDPDFYLEGAYLKFSRDLGMAQHAQNRETASAAQEQVRHARVNAGPAGGSPMGSRRGTEADADAQKLNAYYKHGQETGDWKPYQKARLEMALGPSFLGTMERSSWGR